MIKSGLTLKQGMTLIELLVAATISMVVLGVVLSVFISVWKSQITQEVIADMQGQSRKSVDEITNIVRNAESVSASYSNGGTTYTSDADTLVLQLPSLDANGAVLADKDYVVFERDPNNTLLLKRRIFAAAQSSRATLASVATLNTQTNSILFQYFDSAGTQLIPGQSPLDISARVLIRCKSQKLALRTTVSREFESTVTLRNTGL